MGSAIRLKCPHGWLALCIAHSHELCPHSLHSFLQNLYFLEDVWAKSTFLI